MEEGEEGRRRGEERRGRRGEGVGRGLVVSYFTTLSGVFCL